MEKDKALVITLCTILDHNGIDFWDKLDEEKAKLTDKILEYFVRECKVNDNYSLDSYIDQVDDALNSIIGREKATYLHNLNMGAGYEEMGKLNNTENELWKKGD